MWEELIKMAVSNGIWALLFVALLIYQLKNSEQREKKYQETISSLNSSLECVHTIATDVSGLKKTIIKMTKNDQKETRGKDKDESI